MAWRIGVDSGDTFTDLCLFDDSTGGIGVWKRPSTPDDPARGVAQGIEEAITRAGDAVVRPPTSAVPSDPSAGLLGAQTAGSLAGLTAMIGFDMGGSKTHVAWLPGAPVTAADIHTLEVGGGSVASFQSGSRLKLRPPGDDSGTTGPTVNDANLALQALNPDILLGGSIPLCPELARTAVCALAGRLGTDPPAAAQAILSAVTADIAAAIRAIQPPDGHGRGDITLVAFGGAGPLHAARLARDLGIGRILVPRHPGMLGALGKLLVDLHADFSASRTVELGAGALPAIAEAFGLLRHRAAIWFSEGKVPAKARHITRSVDMRYAGRPPELPVAVPEGPVTTATLDALAAEFAAAHQRIHGFTAMGEKVELVTFRVAATGVVAKPGFQLHPDAGPDVSAARTGNRDVWLTEAGGWVSCPVHDRALLAPGNRIAGPAIVEQIDATTLILPGMTARVEPHLSLVLEWGG